LNREFLALASGVKLPVHVAGAVFELFESHGTFFNNGFPRISPVNMFLHFLKRRQFFVVSLLLTVTIGVAGVTLGPNTRSAVMSRPLDISVQMSPDAGENPLALCLGADVFYAHQQLDPSLIQLTPERIADSSMWLIRIRAETPVNVPVVTVHMRAGCEQKTTRRYVVVATRSESVESNQAGQVLTLPAQAQMGATGDPSTGNLPGQEKVQTLESQPAQLRAELTGQQAPAQPPPPQVVPPTGERYGQLMVYALMAVLLASGGLFLFFRRLASKGRDSRDAGARVAESSLAWAEPATERGALPGAERTLRPKPRPDAEMSWFDELKREVSREPAESIPALPRRDRSRFSVSVSFMPRTVKVPQLFELQLQVELFNSLGRQESAVALLRKHLVNNVKTSALVYLDLLDLYHQIGNKADYETLRADFNRVFNARIAPFDSYTVAGPGAAAFDAVLARVQTVWPGRQVFDVIDDALFREPGNAAEVLDLEAYRDLLLLHAVARGIHEQESGAAGNIGDTRWADLAMKPRSSPRLGLDLDLSEIAGDSEVSKPSDAGRSRYDTDQTPTAFDSLLDFGSSDSRFDR
jgi:hypothetical protein